VTPRLSPDGKTLAFVRRVRTKSWLFVRNMESGEETPVFDRLDKDLQEAWTVQGVYPQYAWTPDGKNIVIWGEGKFWNVNVAATTGAPIPFTVHVETTTVNPVRFTQNVAPDNFDVKMLRHVRVSPDGTKVAYSALGHIYVRNLPTGTLERLTSAGDAATEPTEFAPSWSRDGKSIAHAT
jgi:Tol biopolymer transport system component